MINFGIVTFILEIELSMNPIILSYIALVASSQASHDSLLLNRRVSVKIYEFILCFNLHIIKKSENKTRRYVIKTVI